MKNCPFTISIRAILAKKILILFLEVRAVDKKVDILAVTVNFSETFAFKLVG